MSKKNPTGKTRTQILEAAYQLLNEFCGENVRMADIAKTAGVSRQALYLHFKSRTELMVATVRYGDELRDIASQIRPWTEAKGSKKLEAWILFWGNYIPQIFAIAKALLLAKGEDEAAAAAWNDRMEDVRKSCYETIKTLHDDEILAKEWTIESASDLLWSTLSIEGWEQLTTVRGWTNQQYVRRMQTFARCTFLS